MYDKPDSTISISVPSDTSETSETNFSKFASEQSWRNSKILSCNPYRPCSGNCNAGRQVITGDYHISK